MTNESGERDTFQEILIRDDIEIAFAINPTTYTLLQNTEDLSDPTLLVLAGHVTNTDVLFGDEAKRTVELWREGIETVIILKSDTEMFEINVYSVKEIPLTGEDSDDSIEGHPVIVLNEGGREATGDELELIRMFIGNTEWNAEETALAVSQIVQRTT